MIARTNDSALMKRGSRQMACRVQNKVSLKEWKEEDKSRRRDEQE